MQLQVKDSVGNAGREKDTGGSLLAIVILAALNEEVGIGPTIAELQDILVNPQIVVVDGNSSDRTVEVAKNLGAEILFQDGHGKGDAVAKAVRGLDFVPDYVVLIDADYTYPAEYLPEMIRVLKENKEIGMVCGNRLNHGNE